MFDRIRFLIMLENNFSGVYYHKYMKIKINSNDRLPLETLGMLNIVVLIKSIFSEKLQSILPSNVFRKIFKQIN